MRNYVLSKCPVCSRQLDVKTLYCGNCNTEISGTFSLTKFSYLSKDQLSFVEIFLKNRGNIKDVEKDLNISYPTVRRLLNDVINALGYKTTAQETVSSVDKMEVLAQLERGELSVDAATELLKNK